ncbi:Autophagy- protein 22 [Saitozyma podzolica]|uniref:Autophagy-related protein n=1 Tax=Saitozyma podzolica TaxID=1890683 RepID=A0A427YVM5_9TREE|nr:Autophagy- protein 22 [Saitozyma podzolica]
MRPLLGGGLPPPHVRAWYSYAFAAEVFSACALAIFLPITLEHMARDVGFGGPGWTVPCNDLEEDGGERVCRARILGVWVDTASFSMYVKSIAVATQAICIISVAPLADSPYWRKRLLITFAYIGSISSLLFLPFATPPAFAALLTIVGNVAYAVSIVCANAFLPGLAREDPDVAAALKASQGDGDDGVVPETAYARASVDEEARSLLPETLVPAVRAISAQDLADAPALEGSATTHHATLLSLTMSRLSSTGVALGFLSGVSVLTLLVIPVTVMHGTTASLRLAIGLSGAWWAIFTVPSWLGLPSGPREPLQGRAGEWLSAAWKRVGGMITPREIRALPNLFTFLLAWIFLSDGFHTTTYTAILYASSTLGMSPSKIILIGILVQLAAVFSSILAPRVQKRLGYSNQRLLLHIVLFAEAIPLYACLGLVLPFGGLRTEGEMYVAATYFGLLYGPFNSYSRAVYAELIPPGHESTFFSLFSLTDKSASFIGPAVVGVIADMTGNIRLGFVFLLVMLALPVPVLLRVRVRRGREDATAWAAARTVGATAPLLQAVQ